MQQKQLLILSGVTVAALGIAALAMRSDDAAASIGERARLFPALTARINDVAEVRVEKSGKSATLRRDAGEWKLADRGGYPAKFEKVKEIAMRVSELAIEEEKTSKKENHAKLALEWPAKPADEGAEPSEAGEAGLVTLKDSGGNELASVIVGKSEWRNGKPKVFVRRASEDQVYLCSAPGTGALDVLPDAKTWIDPKFVELQNDRVQSVTIEHADGEVVEINRSAVDHTKFKVQNLPEGQTERYEGVANGVAQALGYGLSLEDVRPVTEIDFTQSPLAKTRFRSVDGLELVVETAKVEDKTWAKVVAIYTPPPEPATPPVETPSDGEVTPPDAAPPGETPPEMPPEEPAAEKKDVGKEAAELNERLAPWAFEIPSYRADVLARHMKDLVPEPATAGSDDGGADALLDRMGAREDEEPVESVPVPDDEESNPPAPDEDEKKPE